jgi:anti-anti-sigma factor
MTVPQATFETEVVAIPEIPDASTIRVRGRVRYGQAPELRQVLLKEIDNTPSSSVVLELSEVVEMDTAGAAVLVEALVHGRKRAKRVLLCSPSDSVLQMFRLAGFEEVLDACCPNASDVQHRLSS